MVTTQTIYEIMRHILLAICPHHSALKRNPIPSIFWSHLGITCKSLSHTFSSELWMQLCSTWGKKGRNQNKFSRQMRIDYHIEIEILKNECKGRIRCI